MFAGSFFEGGMGRDGEIGGFSGSQWISSTEAPDAATGIFPLFERLLREELEGKEGATGEELGWHQNDLGRDADHSIVVDRCC